MFNQDYYKQVRLLLDIMPIVARQNCFALKGGKGLYPKIKIVTHREDNKLVKLFFSELVQVKIEPNLLLRGQIFDSKNIYVSESVKEEFSLELKVSVMSVPDIYGRKA